MEIAFVGGASRKKKLFPLGGNQIPVSSCQKSHTGDGGKGAFAGTTMYTTLLLCRKKIKRTINNYFCPLLKKLKPRHAKVCHHMLLSKISASQN